MPTTRIGPILEAAHDGKILYGTSARGPLDRVVVVGLCVLLMFGPLAFGAVEQWAVLVLKLGTVALFLLWGISQLSAGRIQLRTRLGVPMAIFASVVVAQIVFNVSAYRYVTVQMAMLYVAFGVLCLLATNTLQDSTDDRNFWLILTTFGSLLALLAVAQKLTGSTRMYWLVDPHGGSMFGPYVNRNHYAGLMEMLTPLALVMSMRKDLEAGQRVLLGFAGALMSVSIFMSQSRGGILALCVELLLIAAAIVQKRNRRAGLGLVVVVLAAVALLNWVGMAGAVAGRLGTLAQPLQESTGGNRLAILRDSIQMIRQRPLFGWGLGTFPTVYPRFRSFYTDLFVNQAHNDYLQMLVETGFVGFGAFLAFIVIACRYGLKRIRHWQIRQADALTFAALLGISGIAVHSLLDFNLQIPANAALLYVLCGVAVRHSREAD
jgi:O-antigen ligase